MQAWRRHLVLRPSLRQRRMQRMLILDVDIEFKDISTLIRIMKVLLRRKGMINQMIGESIIRTIKSTDLLLLKHSLLQ